ncbi:hypothetical protein [Flavicella sediminum]|uniref:hypothetical protein n=1 Tax=Flavicella sediminum TaxID=2585141 RepID=UPI001122DBAA|nr:hypothetical protein [Flavicella sediminum]
MAKSSKTELIDKYQAIVDTNKSKIKKTKKAIPYTISGFILVFIAFINYSSHANNNFWGDTTYALKALGIAIITSAIIYILIVIYFVRKFTAENKILNKKLYKLMSLD